MENVDLDTKLHSQEDNLKESTKTIECLQLSIQELSYHAPIIQDQLEDLKQQIHMLTQKAEEADYTFHQMVELEGIRTKNAFMKAKLFIYQKKVKKNRAEQWEFYKTQIIEILNGVFSSY